MSQTAQVLGTVQYRLGDGPMLRVPPGPIQVEPGPNDVTLSWGNDATRQAAAIPASDFATCVAARAIVLTPSPRP